MEILTVTARLSLYISGIDMRNAKNPEIAYINIKTKLDLE
jgi:hypothetical protein